MKNLTFQWHFSVVHVVKHRKISQMYTISLREFGTLENTKLLGSTIQSYIVSVCNTKDSRETSCPVGGIN